MSDNSNGQPSNKVVPTVQQPPYLMGNNGPDTQTIEVPTINITNLDNLVSGPIQVKLLPDDTTFQAQGARTIQVTIPLINGQASTGKFPLQPGPTGDPGQKGDPGNDGQMTVRSGSGQPPAQTGPGEMNGTLYIDTDTQDLYVSLNHNWVGPYAKKS